MFTLELWFKRTGAGVGTSTGTGGLASAIPLITKGRAEAETPANLNMNYFLGIDAASGTLVADFEEARPDDAGLTIRSPARPSITNNVWHHAAATYDGSTWQLYLDGTLDRDARPGGAARARGDQHPARGARHGDELDRRRRRLLPGRVDEARIWNVARSQAEIQATKNTEIGAQAGPDRRCGTQRGHRHHGRRLSGRGINGTLSRPRGPPAAVARASPSPTPRAAAQRHDQYVTFGAARRELGASHVHARAAGSGGPAPASARAPGTGGIASAIPLITKGRAEAETPRTST